MDDSHPPCLHVKQERLALAGVAGKIVFGGILFPTSDAEVAEQLTSDAPEAAARAAEVLTPAPRNAAALADIVAGLADEDDHDEGESPAN